MVTIGQAGDILKKHLSDKNLSDGVKHPYHSRVHGYGDDIINDVSYLIAHRNGVLESEDTANDMHNAVKMGSGTVS